MSIIAELMVAGLVAAGVSWIAYDLVKKVFISHDDEK